MSKITQEIAEKEVLRWLDARCTSESKKLKMSETIKELENAVMDGKLIVKDDATLCQKLDFPIGDEAKILELNFKNRLAVGDIQKRMTGNNVKMGDIDGRIMVYASVLTDLAYGQIAKMDSSDYSLTSTVANFFF